MSGEWTTTQLKELFEVQIRRLEERIAAETELRRSGREDDREAIGKAEAAMNVRIALLNEFRQQSIDEQKNFLPRETYDASLAAWTDWRATVERRLNLTQGRSVGISMSAAVLASVVTIVLAALAVYLANHH